MTAKEAREIQERYIERTYSETDEFLLDVGTATGFLEAIEKMKPVVEAIENVEHGHLCRVGWSDPRYGCNCHLVEIEEAMKYYRREVLGESE